MTDPNYTHITMLMDRTGSMQVIKADAEGAVNAFIETHKAADGKCTLLLIDFDQHTYPAIESEINHVVYDGPIADAPQYRLEPRGNTPLLDAMAAAIRATGRKLAALDEAERPGHVIFVTQTDGEENSSREISQMELNELIKDHEQRWNWTFIFLATGPDAFSAAGRFTGTRMMTANTVANTGKGTSHYASTQYLADATLAQRSGAREPDVAYAAVVDDAGNVETEAETE